jgi:hypothetical protein
MADVVVPARRAASAKEPASATRTKATTPSRSMGNVGVDMMSILPLSAPGYKPAPARRR